MENSTMNPLALPAHVRSTRAQGSWGFKWELSNLIFTDGMILFMKNSIWDVFQGGLCPINPWIPGVVTRSQSRNKGHLVKALHDENSLAPQMTQLFYRRSVITTLRCVIVFFTSPDVTPPIPISHKGNQWITDILFYINKTLFTKQK